MRHGLGHVQTTKLCIVCHAGPEDVDADSVGPQDESGDLAETQLDVRERIYDMVRPLDWMKEAAEPPGAAWLLLPMQS